MIFKDHMQRSDTFTCFESFWIELYPLIHVQSWDCIKLHYLSHKTGDIPAFPKALSETSLWIFFGIYQTA